MKKACIIIIGIIFAVILALTTLRGSREDNDSVEKEKVAKQEVTYSVSPTPVILEITDIPTVTPTQEPLKLEVPRITSEPTPTVEPTPTEEVIPTEEDLQGGQVEKIDDGESTHINENINNGMVEIDINTIPYDEDNVKTAEVIISEKHVYLADSQLQYQLYLEPSGKSDIKEVLKYFVNFSDYNSCILGTKMTVQYELFANGVLSINSLKILK